MSEAQTVLHLEGALLAPVDCGLRSQVRELLGKGERQILLDLSHVSDVDAAGVGELVRVHNTTAAAGGVLRVEHARGHVREVLTRVGLYELLHADSKVAA